MSLILPPFDVTIWMDASKKGWGAAYLDRKTGGQWAMDEEKAHINVLELKAAYLAIQSFVKDMKSLPRHILLLMDNFTAVCYVNKRGSTRSPQLVSLATEIWNFCLGRNIWITAKHVPGVENVDADCASRQFHNHTERVDFGQEDLPTYHSALLSSGSGSICVADKQPTPKVHSQVPRSRVDCDGSVPSELEQMDPIHPSSCCSASKDLTEDKERSGNLIVDSSSMERPTLVPSPTGTVNRLSYSSADDREDNLSPVRPSDDPSVMANAETSCMAAFRGRLQATGLSDEVCKILQSSWRQTTQKRYEGPWKLWSSWCLQRNLDPFSAPVVDVLAFLAEQFNMRGLAYRTISVYKACISQIHNPVEGQQLGNLPIVSRFMKGVFQLKPAVPKTCSTWSVGPVLQYLSSLEPLEKLSIKDLTLKLTMLVALASAARVHEIAALDCGSVIKKTIVH